MDNAEIARVLSETADLLELTGGNAFKVRAYRQAAQVIDALPHPAAELCQGDRLTELPGIGGHIAAHIADLVGCGDFDEHRAVAGRVPPGVLEILRLEGVGPKTTAALWKRLRILNVDALESACRDGRILKVPRLGLTRSRSILESIGRYRQRQGRTLLHRALAHADAILAPLRRLDGVVAAEAAGSVRRRRETVGDLDLLVATKRPGPVLKSLVALPEVERVIAQGPTKGTVRLRDGLQVDVRVVAPESFGAALHYFTGSKTHNIALRTRAQRMGIKLNEYGIFDRHDRRTGGAREEEVFAAVGLPFIPPELREGAGEIEAAESGRLPALIEEGDVRGDLHVHSDASSDGHSTLEELLVESRRLGRSYVAITDHSRSRPLGIGVEALKQHAAEIRALNGTGRRRPRLLAGLEVDILPDGTLDLPVEALRDLDWVVASIHSHFNDPPERITARLLRAVRSGVVDAIGHPTGRQIGAREPYAFDCARVLEAAREHHVALEVNGQPDRLDFDDKHCRLAKESGVKVVIDSDAHLAGHLENLRFGIWIARRGWLQAGDVLNTRGWEEVRAFRRGRRARAA